MKTMKLLLTALCVLSLSTAVFAKDKNAKMTTKAKAVKVISDEQYWSNIADELIAKEVKRQKLDGNTLEISTKNDLLSAAISRLASELNRRKKSEQQLEADVDEMGM